MRLADLFGRAAKPAGSAATPDGQADTLQAESLQAGAELAHEEASKPRPPHRPVAHPATIIQAALAQKLLHGWVQNRYQTRYPLTLNLRNNSPAERDLLTQSVQAALRATEADPETHHHAETWITAIGGTFADPTTPPTPLFDQLHTARLVPQAYAICAGALRRRTPANRRYLDFLAARLGLPDDVARSLNRRFAG